jgi:long-chain acyl-CoA synthetase
MNLYDNIIRQSTTNPGSIALTYFGRNITYGEFELMIYQTVNGLKKLGVSAGDIVSISLPTTPESIATLYALNIMGATICTIDVRFTAEKVASIVNNTNSKILFIMSFNLKKIARITDRINCDHIVVLRGCESFPKQASLGYAFCEYFNGRHWAYKSDKRFINWGSFSSESFVKPPYYSWGQDAAQIIFQTSGTTGETKSVMVSAENIEDSTVLGYQTLNNPSLGDSVLSLIPIFAFYGFHTQVHLPLCYGMRVDIIPIWKIRNFIKILVSHKPNHIFTVPSYWDVIMQGINKKYDLSFIKTILCTGDYVAPNFERCINLFLHNSNCNKDILKGYGMTETAGFISSTHITSKHKYDVGFQGKIAPHVSVKLIDKEICVHLNTKVLGYYGNTEASELMIQTHNDGKQWVHTGDIGEIDEEGNLYVKGRIKRMIVKYDGTKCFPIEIESILTNHPNIKQCVVVGISDKTHPQSQIPVAFVIPRKHGLFNKHSFSRYCTQNLPTYLVPVDIFILKKMPITPRGKIDYTKLSQLANRE